MSHFLLLVAAGVLGILIALPVSLYATRSIRRSSKRPAGFAFAAALLFAFPFVSPRGPALIEEAKDETRRKKDSQSGDPPDPVE